MRLLFATPAYPPFPGGGERYVRSLALGLVRLGHQVTVLTSNASRERDFWRGTTPDQYVEEMDEGVHVIRHPIKGIPGSRPGLLAWRKSMVLLSALPGDQSALLMRMARLIPPIAGLEDWLVQTTDSFDLVHGFNISWEYPLVMGWRFARRRDIPFVITPFAHFGTGKRDRIALNGTMDHQRRIMSDANAVLTLTSIESGNLRRWQVFPQHMDVVGSGLDPFPPIPDPVDVLNNYELVPPYALFVGRAARDKGALDAVQAVLMLTERGIPLTLALIGQTTPEFDRLWTQLGEPERRVIRPLGILSDPEKHAILESSTMLLLPSRTDSFGIVLLEAWAHGKPVIGANAGGIPGVVDDGQNGLLINFGEVDSLSRAIETLLTDAALNKKMGEHGRSKVAEKYTWESVSESVLANYRRDLVNSS